MVLPTISQQQVYKGQDTNLLLILLQPQLLHQEQNILQLIGNMLDDY